ncbi:tRNA (adenine-N(1)-)-Methyltransferase [Colletotrichum higginsianum]|nr:tRNA (adenine-N(1)-)-Methyltransferase [Colletotrichum higginsianum]
MEFAFSVASKHSEVIHGHMGSFTDEKNHSENAIRDSCIKPMVELDDQSQSYSATAASHFWEVAQADTIAGIDNPLQQDGLADTDGAVQAGSAMAIDVPGPKLQCKGRPIAEDDILSAVTDLLDPIAAIEAYADSDKKEYVLGQKRRLKKIATRASHKKKKIAGHYV